jgi:hypothetical protein
MAPIKKDVLPPVLQDALKKTDQTKGISDAHITNMAQLPNDHTTLVSNIAKLTSADNGTWLSGAYGIQDTIIREEIHLGRFLSDEILRTLERLDLIEKGDRDVSLDRFLEKLVLKLESHNNAMKRFDRIEQMLNLLADKSPEFAFLKDEKELL